MSIFVTIRACFLFIIPFMCSCAHVKVGERLEDSDMIPIFAFYIQDSLCLSEIESLYLSRGIKYTFSGSVVHLLYVDPIRASEAMTLISKNNKVFCYLLDGYVLVSSDPALEHERLPRWRRVLLDK